METRHTESRHPHEIGTYVSGKQFDNYWARQDLMKMANDFIGNPHANSILLGKLLSHFGRSKSTMQVDVERGCGLATDIDRELGQINIRQKQIDVFLFELRSRLSSFWLRMCKINSEMQSLERSLQPDEASLLKALHAEKQELDKAIGDAEKACRNLERKADDLRTDFQVLVRLLTRIESLTRNAAFADKWETFDPVVEGLYVTEAISPVYTSEKAINTKNIPRVEDTNDDKTGMK